jgi:catechol 2,3-dioxygenase-like lactoylglutathione lyase family enzyme
MIAGGIATIYVSDMDRAIRFYTETLGLKLQYRAGQDWASIGAGRGLILGLHGAREGRAAGQSGSISVGFSVTEPLGEVVETLRQRGVGLRGPIREDTAARLAFFGDPDGNDLYLAEARAMGSSTA